MNCPKCESKKVVTRGKGFYFMLFFGIASLSLIVGIFIPPVLFGLAFLLATPLAFFMKPTHQCQECNHVWKDEKVEASA